MPDENVGERGLREFALGHKSWRFAGPDCGADRGTGMATPIPTAKINDPPAWAT